MLVKTHLHELKAITAEKHYELYRRAVRFCPLMYTSEPPIIPKLPARSS